MRRLPWMETFDGTRDGEGRTRCICRVPEQDRCVCSHEDAAGSCWSSPSARVDQNRRLGAISVKGPRLAQHYFCGSHPAGGGDRRSAPHHAPRKSAEGVFTDDQKRALTSIC